jgi:hypothetical protein
MKTTQTKGHNLEIVFAYPPNINVLDLNPHFTIDNYLKTQESA